MFALDERNPALSSLALHAFLDASFFMVRSPEELNETLRNRTLDELEDLPQLRVVNKWLSHHDTLAVGDIVIIMDDPDRGSFPLGKITEVHKNPTDNVVRDKPKAPTLYQLRSRMKLRARSPLRHHHFAPTPQDDPFPKIRSAASNNYALKCSHLMNAIRPYNPFNGVSHAFLDASYFMVRTPEELTQALRD
jgi:hypothetical protein